MLYNTTLYALLVTGLLFALGFLAAIDVLLVVRFFSYINFLKNHPKGPPTAS